MLTFLRYNVRIVFPKDPDTNYRKKKWITGVQSVTYICNICTPRPRQKGHKMEDSLDYIASSRLA